MGVACEVARGGGAGHAGEDGVPEREPELLRRRQQRGGQALLLGRRGTRRCDRGRDHGHADTCPGHQEAREHVTEVGAARAHSGQQRQACGCDQRPSYHRPLVAGPARQAGAQHRGDADRDRHRQECKPGPERGEAQQVIADGPFLCQCGACPRANRPALCACWPPGACLRRTHNSAMASGRLHRPAAVDAGGPQLGGRRPIALSGGGQPPSCGTILSPSSGRARAQSPTPEPSPRRRQSSARSQDHSDRQRNSARTPASPCDRRSSVSSRSGAASARRVSVPDDHLPKLPYVARLSMPSISRSLPRPASNIPQPSCTSSRKPQSTVLRIATPPPPARCAYLSHSRTAPIHHPRRAPSTPSSPITR